MGEVFDESALGRAVERCRENGVLIPTYEQMANPELIPKKIVEELKKVGLWEVNPLNLFRITWKNEPVMQGGGFGKVNYIEIPKEISGVDARIIMLVGKFFPTGAHKVGATFGPLVSKLTTGEFDPSTQKALWPSTGNYCRGGAFNSRLLGCKAIAVLPEDMSKERFNWLKEIGAEVHATPGCESNVKEVFDKNTELVKEGKGKVVSFNQFAEFGNPLYHYSVTGRAMEEVFNAEKTEKSRVAGICLTQGSAGTIGCGMYMKKKFPSCKVAASEADQCPTLLENGFGGHRIEGIGDKHVPWVLNCKDMDMVVDVDDNVCMSTMQLFNNKEGLNYLRKKGVKDEFISKLELMGISGIANMLASIKMAKYYEMTKDDVVFSICTDSMEMYKSRVEEMVKERGEYSAEFAIIDYATLMGLKRDRMLELSYYDRKRLHNLKYFTWIEQQGKTKDELDEQWYCDEYWEKHVSEKVVDQWNKNISAFNSKTGLDKKY